MNLYIVLFYERETLFHVVVYDDTVLLLKLEVVLSSTGIWGTGG